MREKGTREAECWGSEGKRGEGRLKWWERRSGGSDARVTSESKEGV